MSLLLVAFVWGASFVMIQNAIAFLPPFTFNAIRFFLSGLSLIFIALFLAKKGDWKNALLPGLFLGTILFLAYALQTIGLLYTTPSKSGFITGLSVILVPFLALLLLKSKPSTSAIVGSILACLGLFLLTSGHVQAFNTGDLLTLFCAIGFALHIILTARFTKNCSTIVLTTVQIVTVALLSGLGSVLFEGPKDILLSEALFQKDVFVALIVTALLATSAAFFIQTWAQKNTAPSRVAIILTMEPVFATIVSYFWIQETLTLLAVVGCVFIFLGMLLSEMPFLAKLQKYYSRRKKVA